MSNITRPFFLAILLLVFCLGAPVYAQTRLYLHATTASIAGYKDMTLSLGAGVVTLVTNTAAGGTDIQVTNTAGGTAQAWISPAVVTGFTLSGTVTCNVYGGESATTANTAFRCRLYKYSGGAEGAAILTANMTTELTTSLTTVRNWTGTPTSTAFAAGDRLVLKLFLENCATSGCPTGSMAAGQTATIRYDGVTVGADGATWVQVTQTLDFGVDITSNLIAWYRLDDAQGVDPVDSSGNGNTASLGGSPATPSASSGCHRGTCLSFDGGDWANTNITTALTDFTACVWFNDSNDGAFGRLLDKDAISGFWLGHAGEPADPASYGGGVLEGVPPYGRFVTLTTNAWHHICSVRSGTGHTIYADRGAATATGTVSASALDTSMLRIGTNPAGGDGFTGKIDEVYIYSRALTTADMNALFDLTDAVIKQRHRTLLY
jgi:hypothetical protein